MLVRSLLSLFAGFATVAAAAPEPFRFERPLMGTRFAVVCHAGDREAAAAAAEAAFRAGEKVNEVASDYSPESELSRLSSCPVGEPVPLSPLLFELLAHSRVLAEATGGAFDPTLGPLSQLWRETRERRRLPDAARLAAARESVGWRHFTLDPDARTITLHRDGMAFDLGGVAKGYAADLMLESLADDGMPRSLVAAGGDIRLGEAPPGRDGWKVALRTFDPDRPDEVLTLANAAVSTSGDLHQSVEIDGVTYSHILDPGTGLGLTRRIAASVVAASAKLSDPLATAACVLGPGEDARDRIEKLAGVRDVRIRIPRTQPETPPAK